MRKTIFLRTQYIDLKAKKLSKSELLVLQEKAFKLAVKQFKEQTASSPIKITKQCFPQPEIVIEFPDKNEEVVLALLRKAEVVEIIDAHVYTDTHVQAEEPEDFKSIKEQLRAKIEKR